ncbi:MAG: two-component system sensor histidine kinase NtrB [Desulfurivibrionaceae bacterium]
MKKILLWILFFRVLLITVSLGITVILEQGEVDLIYASIDHVIIFTAFVYVFTIISAFIARRLPYLRTFSCLQIITDIILTSILIIFTQSSQSIFTIIYFFPIICGAFLLRLKGGLLMASITTLCYGMVLYAEYTGISARVIPGFISHLSNPETGLHHFAVFGISYFLVAILSSLLIERLYSMEKALTATSRDLDQLSYLYKQIFDDVSTGILTVDARGNITSCNRAAENIIGYSSSEIEGWNLADYLPQLYMEKKSDREDRPMVWLTRKDGAEIPVGYSWTPLNIDRDAGESRVYTMQDLSRIKEMEDKVRQSEKMAAVGKMAAGLAHEFRNPIAAISGASQVLNKDIPDNSAQKGLIKIISRESKRLEITIRDFLQFSKPAVPEKEWASLSGIVDEVVELFSQQHAGWSDSYRVKKDFPENMDVWGDRAQLKQVLINLIDNAAEAMGNKNGVINISVNETEGNDDPVVIEVSDTGEGFTENSLNKIFDPFYTGKRNGTGLGLAIVKQLVEGHGGTVRAANNQEGSGAAISFTLPLPD